LPKRLNFFLPSDLEIQGSVVFLSDRVMASLGKYKLLFSEKEGDEELRTSFLN